VSPDFADDPSFELAWPRELFVSEASALLEGFDLASSIELLLTEAFRSERLAQRYAHKPSRQRSLLEQLVQNADTLRQPFADPPYWPERYNPSGVDPAARSTKARKDFRALIVELRKKGYFDEKFPQDCLTVGRGDERDISAEIAERIGVPDLWPLKPSAWSDDTYYGLIEVFHDLVARPRHLVMKHKRPDGVVCAHYAEFSRPPGQQLYRWRVARLLARHGIGLRLAGDGGEAGRLVGAAGDDRDRLVESAFATPDAAARDTVRLAVALFRGRTSGRSEKRSAIVALAGLLEQRRALLETRLLSKDENALFQIANEFALRHRRADQRDDYAEAYLDWIFWWYLGTVELTNQLLLRPAL
jgi:hypothetical protein